jgi:hypothetical protein
MQACRHQNETLMLDVLGELRDPQMRRDWEDHLKACGDCRRERLAMLSLLAKVKRAGMPPELSAEQADAMAKAVGWKLRNERIQPVRQGGRRFRFLPVCASVCALIAVLFLGYQLQDRPVGGRDNEMAMMPQDLEVIQHLDLLKDMETIEKLIQVVDIPDPMPSTEQDAPETQGVHWDDNRKSYAS